MILPDLTQPILNKILATSGITGLLTAFPTAGKFPVWTRRPAPDGSPKRAVFISPDVTTGDDDGVDFFSPIITRDLSVYDLNDKTENYRAVELIAYRLHSLFNAERLSIVVPSWHVVQINCVGPRPAPVDDDRDVGRVVSMTIQLAQAG